MIDPIFLSVNLTWAIAGTKICPLEDTLQLSGQNLAKQNLAKNETTEQKVTGYKNCHNDQKNVIL